MVGLLFDQTYYELIGIMIGHLDHIDNGLIKIGQSWSDRGARLHQCNRWPGRDGWTRLDK